MDGGGFELIGGEQKQHRLDGGRNRRDCRRAVAVRVQADQAAHAVVQYGPGEGPGDDQEDQFQNQIRLRQEVVGDERRQNGVVLREKAEYEHQQQRKTRHTGAQQERAALLAEVVLDGSRVLRPRVIGDLAGIGGKLVLRPVVPLLRAEDGEAGAALFHGLALYGRLFPFSASLAGARFCSGCSGMVLPVLRAGAGSRSVSARAVRTGSSRNAEAVSCSSPNVPEKASPIGKPARPPGFPPTAPRGRRSPRGRRFAPAHGDRGRRAPSPASARCAGGPASGSCAPRCQAPARFRPASPPSLPPGRRGARGSGTNAHDAFLRRGRADAVFPPARARARRRVLWPGREPPGRVPSREPAFPCACTAAGAGSSAGSASERNTGGGAGRKLGCSAFGGRETRTMPSVSSSASAAAGTGCSGASGSVARDAALLAFRRARPSRSAPLHAGRPRRRGGAPWRRSFPPAPRRPDPRVPPAPDRPPFSSTRAAAFASRDSRSRRWASSR